MKDIYNKNIKNNKDNTYLSGLNIFLLFLILALSFFLIFTTLKSNVAYAKEVTGFKYNGMTIEDRQNTRAYDLYIGDKDSIEIALINEVDGKKEGEFFVIVEVHEYKINNSFGKEKEKSKIGTQIFFYDDVKGKCLSDIMEINNATRAIDIKYTEITKSTHRGRSKLITEYYLFDSKKFVEYNQRLDVQIKGIILVIGVAILPLIYFNLIVGRKKKELAILKAKREEQYLPKDTGENDE